MTLFYKMNTKLTCTGATLAYWAFSTSASAQNANVRGALETNQEALAEAASAQLNEDGVKGGAQALTNALLALVGFAGIAMVAYAIGKVWGHYKEGDQARGNVMSYWAMMFFGGLMTIAAIVTAFFPQLILDGV